mmetsp:Transcript_91509/g.267779  ORF Transcript_91509/g.267779 Transcript_91509/m.267779 type:complete len:223 (-) Transcript_91509:383-1051(-)
MTEYTARITSNKFHFQSSPNKNFHRFATRRNRISMTKNPTNIWLVSENHTGSSCIPLSMAFSMAKFVAMPMKTALERMIRLQNIWKGFPSTRRSNLEAGSSGRKRERRRGTSRKPGSETALDVRVFLLPARRWLRRFLSWLFHCCLHFSSSSFRKCDWISVSCRARAWGRGPLGDAGCSSQSASVSGWPYSTRWGTGVISLGDATGEQGVGAVGASESVQTG